MDDDFVADASEAVADDMKAAREFAPPRKLFSGFELEELWASTLLALSTANEAARTWLRNIFAFRGIWCESTARSS